MWGGYEKYDNPHILRILIFFVISKFFEVLFFMTIILCKDYHGFGNVEFMEIISKKKSKLKFSKNLEGTKMWRGYEECEVPHISRTLLTFFVPIVIFKFFNLSIFFRKLFASISSVIKIFA